MEGTAIFFGSNGGATESVAKQIADKLDGAKVFDVANVSASETEKYQNLILGTSTWGIGDLQDDWENFLPDLDKEDLSNKNIALFGLGDGESYPDSFVDAMGTLYDELQNKGCSFVGQVDTAEYNFDDSKAIYNGKFVGLALDEDNESDLTEVRIKNWVAGIKSNLL